MSLLLIDAYETHQLTFI